MPAKKKSKKKEVIPGNVYVTPKGLRIGAAGLAGDLLPGEAAYVAEAMQPGVTPLQAAKKCGRNKALSSKRVKAVLAAAIDEQITEANITAIRTLKEIAKCGYVNVCDVVDSVGRPVPIQDLHPDVQRAIVGIEVEDVWEFQYDQATRRKIKVWKGRVVKYKFAKEYSLRMLAQHHRILDGAGGPTKDRLDEMLAALRDPAEQKAKA